MSEQNGLIVRRFNEVEIRQRPADRYLDATAMCRAAGKQWKHYHENKGTRDYIAALSESVGIPTDSLVEARPSRGGGTFVHPLIAVHLAQWLSPAFAVQVATWTEELLTTGRVELAPPAPSTPGEVALAMAQGLVAVERRLALLERRQAEDDARREESSRRLLSVERSPDAPPAETTRDKVRRLVNVYCAAADARQGDVYTMLYDRLYYSPASRNFSTRTYRQAHNLRSDLEAVEHAGHIELLFAIASKELKTPTDGRILHDDT